MGAFVSKTPVKVTVEGRPDEYISIAPKLGAGARADMQNKLLSVKMGEDADGERGADVNFQAGMLNLLLLEAGVTGWKLKGEAECGLELDDEGFVKFKHDYIRSLDLDDDLVDAALGELAKRNPLSAKPQSESKSG